MASDGETSCANDPNFAAIYSFLKVFGKLHGLELPTINKLQEFIENTEEVSDALKELHLKLLRRALKSAHSNRWEKCMIKFCHQQGHHQEAWEIERFSYKKASTQVKLKVLKFLLEFQFTCHPKFKTAINAIPSKELRLDPIGRDKNGCVYWLQVDSDANLCLYKEDQDEETWQLIARNREELVKVIAQLKSGEEITPSSTCTENEASSEPEETLPPEKPLKPEVDEDNEEEFLSPESESENEETGSIKNQITSDNTSKETPSEELPLVKDETVDNTAGNNELVKEETQVIKESATETSEEVKSIKSETETKPEAIINESSTDSESCLAHNSTPVVNEICPTRDSSPAVDEDSSKHFEEIKKEDTTNESIECKNISIEDNQNISNIEDKHDENTLNNECEPTVCSNDKIEDANKLNTESESIESSKDKIEGNANIKNESDEHEPEKERERGVDHVKHEDNEINLKQDEELSEAIEDPLVVVTGDGNGADCDSFFLGEEISEDIMYIYGEGYGYDNDTGNPEAIPETDAGKSEDENDSKEIVTESKDLVNGEHDTNSSKLNNVKLKSVSKRSLKKQPNDSNDANPDTKKPCMRDEKLNTSKAGINSKTEASVNDKSTTDSESPRKNIEASGSTSPKKNNVKKRRSKVKKKAVVRKIKNNPINSVDNGQDKISIIEKRKSSVSSVDEDLADICKANAGKEDPLAVEELLPPKKLRLEPTPPSDENAPHSKDVSDAKETASDGKEATSDGANETKDQNDSISKRKKIKAHKGKFKRKTKNKDVEKNDKANDRNKTGGKSLKRSLVEAIMSDKNKSESQSESEDDEPITSGKRLKIKPKKIITSSRKKVEAKLLEKQSSDESEEETLYSIAAGKKTASKKLIKKKKSKNSKDSKDKKSKTDSDDSDTPVRQSRRIAQQKIKEEAERRHLEEVALRELKMIHKKKGKDDDDDEEEWRASGRGSSTEEEKKRSHKKTWRTSDSTGPEPDSDSDSPLFELQPEPEPEPDYDKSDHEFSPESDLESEEPAEPLKRARTLQEEKDDGFCKQCGSGEQPEWILLCDKCDSGYHASCLKPLLFYIPQGDWFCPPCNHEKLIQSLESELLKLDELTVIVEDERARKKLEEPEPVPDQPKAEKKDSDDDSEASSYSSWSSVSSGGVYRLRARRQVPVSLRAQEYDRLISAAIKEEYVEPTTSAGNQGRGKDISTIIEAAEEEKMKAERDAIDQGMPVESKKSRKKQRKKPRKLNSLDVPSEDDDEVDEDFKDTGGASSSEDISSSADKDSGDSRSSDSLPIRRTGRSENKKDRPKMTESSPESKKKKKGVFEDSSSESTGAKEWASASKPKPKSSHHHHHHHRSKDQSQKRDKSKKARRSRGLTQYDAEGNVIRARVTYGGLSGEEGENDWSPKHRTRQKKINYTETPNTESEDEMHKSSGKHMPDSSDEFKVTESSDSDWDAEQKKKEESNAERMKALNDLVKKTAVVPLEKLPEDVTRAKTEELKAHLDAQAAANATPKPVRGKGSRGGRGSRGPRGRGGRGGRSTRSGSPQTDDALAKLVGVKVKELGQDGSPTKPNQVEREKKRQEREAKQAEKEAKRQERLQKKEEKDKLKEQKAREREEKKLAKIALQESKRVKKEKEYAGPMVGYGPPPGGMGGEMFQPRPPVPYHDQRFPNAPRLQVRAELRGMLAGDDRASHSQQQHNALREGTLSVAGSPQPFKPVSEEPSIITRMPHMINQQYRGPMMYPNNAGYGPRGPQNMYQLHPGLGGPGGPGGGGPRQYPPQYYRLPPYGPARPEPPPHQAYRHHMQGPPTSMHHPGPPGSMHHQPGFGYRGPPPTSMPQGHPDRAGTSPNPPSHLGGPMGHLTGPPNSHGPQNPNAPGILNPNHQSGPGHLGGPPSHLSGPPPHLNQLGRPPGLPNPLGPNSHGPNPHESPNSHGGSPISHGPPNQHAGPPISHRLPNPLRGPPNSHGGPQNPHGGPPNSHGGPPNLHGGPPNSHGGPLNSHGGPPNLHGGPGNPLGGPQNSFALRNQLEANQASPMARGSSPAPSTSGMKHGAPGSVPSPHDEPPIKIKAEVKTEPEYRSPPTSPGESIGVARAEEPPRHPKIKHTDNKERRPRFPLGPYAPHYAPYGPYAPHYAPEPHHALQQYLSSERARSPAPGGGEVPLPPRPYLPAHLRPYGGGVVRAPGMPPHSHHPMPNPSRDPPSAPPDAAPAPPASSPPRAPFPAHPHPLVPGASPPASHRLQAHHRMPSQPTPLLAHHHSIFPPRAHSQPTTTLAAGKPMQAHLAPARSPLRSPGPPRRQSLTPPQSSPLLPPYVQQPQMVPAPAVPSRPTPPPPLAQSPSPHMLQQPRHTPPPHPARTPPTLAHHLPPPHERASPNVPVPYQYAERRLLLPQPIPRDSLPPRSPPRRDFEPPESRLREFDPEAPPRDFESPESPKETAQRAEADSTIAIKTEPALGRPHGVKEEPNREESGVFGGLVSYFSSQHEDDIDA